MNKKNITIIDYGLGNIYSISNILKKLNCNVNFSNDKKRILASDGLILPGVGSFKKGMEEIKKRNLDVTINKFVLSKKPLLGICLGMQLLLNSSPEFGYTKGLSLINGKVKKISTNKSIKLPNVNWLNISFPNKEKNKIISNISTKDTFYFVHSYVCEIENQKDVVAFSRYFNIKFVSIFKYKNIIGCQFHPEKSSESGIKFYKNFLRLC